MDRSRTWIRLPGQFLLGMAMAAGGPALGQQPAGRVQVQAQGVFVQAADENADASFVQPDREQLQLLSRARRMLEQERYSEAIRDLGRILSDDADGVLPRQGDETPRFLKAEA